MRFSCSKMLFIECCARKEGGGIAWLLTVNRNVQELGTKCSKEGAPWGCPTRAVVRTALFWAVTQRVAVLTYRRSGTNCHSPQGSCLPFIGTTYPWWDPTGCPETSLRICHYTLCNCPKGADPYRFTGCWVGAIARLHGKLFLPPWFELLTFQSL